MNHHCFDGFEDSLGIYYPKIFVGLNASVPLLRSLWLGALSPPGLHPGLYSLPPSEA
jgi:hypothetical protein